MFLIDGNNLCGAARDRRLGLPMGEQEMLLRLASFAEARRVWLSVVFDGPAGPRRGAGLARGVGRVRVIHSGSGASADDRIVEAVGGCAHPRDVTVVTSDRALQARVGSLGARVMGCRDFAARMAAAGKRGASVDDEDKPLPGDTEYWERYFAGEG